MPTTDPRIDDYIERAAPFAQPILTHLRSVVHAACPDVEETMKWSRPHFLYQGKILAGMSAFKAHCAFGFWYANEALGSAPEERAMGQFGRITTLSDLPAARTLRSHAKAAMQHIDAGTPRTPKAATAPRPALATPDDLAAALAGTPAARQTFEGFSATNRRDYVEWIIEAKRPETRARRIEQAVEWLAEGKRRNWKYEAC